MDKRNTLLKIGKILSDRDYELLSEEDLQEYWEHFHMNFIVE